MNKGFIDIHHHKVEACRRGSRAAQRELYELYAQAMFNVALRIVRHREFAEDVLQESFVKAFTQIHTFRGESTFGSWLKRIVINQALGKLKLEKLSFEPMQQSHEAIADADETLVIDDLDVNRVKQAIMRLPDGYRTVLSLYLLEGLDHEEISEVLGISKSTSKTQYMRAKDKLKNMLKSEGRAYG